MHDRTRPRATRGPRLGAHDLARGGVAADAGDEEVGGFSPKKGSPVVAGASACRG